MEHGAFLGDNASGALALDRRARLVVRGRKR